MTRTQGKAAAAASAAVFSPDTCGSCRFWRGLDEKRGHCRRFPPTPLASAGCTFPVTFADNWCGEHDQDMAEAEKPVGFAPPVAASVERAA